MTLIAQILIFLLIRITCAQSSKNVLFIISDDLRPEINAFQNPDSPSPPMYTPNLDRLASESLVLTRAYCQQAVCAPSRASFLTGRRPDTTHVYDLQSYWREVGGDFTTIPQYFKENGYRSIGIGKVFHPGSSSGNNDKISWTEEPYHSPNNDYYTGKELSWYSVTAGEREEMPLPDDQLIEHASSWLVNISQESPSDRQPFFIGLGLYKPHLPFVFPEEMLQYYPENDIELPDNPYAPINMPSIAWSKYGELRNFNDIEDLNITGEINTTLPDTNVLDLRRAYYASVTYVDLLVGNILDVLEQTGLANETIVSFIGDHGFQLGEHGQWVKHTNFDIAAYSPMMIRIPGKTDNGVLSDAFTELVDLYPTVVEAAGLPEIPLCPLVSNETAVCREGQSLMPLIDSPAAETWKDRVFFQYPRGGGDYEKMGYSMRTENFHYTEWVGFSGEPDYLIEWDNIYGVELYDMSTDPQENYNVANNPQYADVLPELHNKLVAGWRAAL